MTLEFSSRLVNAFVPDANLHIGWHWDPAALARWTSMMMCSSRLGLGLVHAAQENFTGDVSGEARSRLVKEMLVM